MSASPDERHGLALVHAAGGAAKRCAKCGETKPCDEFAADRGATDGLFRWCRSCASSNLRRWYRLNAEAKQARDAAWRAANPGYHTQHAKLYRQLHPARVAACNLLRTAIRNGTIVRPDSCEKCGCTCRPDAHHHDYSRPLDVAWLCRRCHRGLHGVEQSRELGRRRAEERELNAAAAAEVVAWSLDSPAEVA